MNATFLILFFTAFLNISSPTVYFDGGWYMDWGCNVHIGYGHISVESVSRKYIYH